MCNTCNYGVHPLLMNSRSKKSIFNKGLTLTFTFDSDWLGGRSNIFYIKYFLYVSPKNFDASKVFLLEWCLFERLQVQLLWVLGIFWVHHFPQLHWTGMDRLIQILKAGGILEEEHELLNGYTYILTDIQQQLVLCAHFHQDWWFQKHRCLNSALNINCERMMMVDKPWKIGAFLVGGWALDSLGSYGFPTSWIVFVGVWRLPR